jgi:flagellar protein FliS
MNPYKEHALEGASGIELTIALYDGIIRFMRSAIDAAECGDTGGRRAAVRRAMDIVLYLRATLQMDIGGKPAKALEEFYAAMVALMLQGSQANSGRKFEEVIANVWNVREAWRQLVRGPVRPASFSIAAPEELAQPAGSTSTDRSDDVYGRNSSSWIV